MKTKLRLLIGFGLVLSLSALLSACGAPKETPEQVIPKFKSTSSQLTSARLAGDVRIVGADQNNGVDATLTFKSQFDYSDAAKNKGAVELGLKGSMTTEGKKSTGDIALAFTTIGSDFYLNLTKLDTDQEDIQKIKPFLSGYTNKWLHLSPDLLPKNIRELQEQQTKNRDAIRKLIAESSFFTVTKEYGVESVDGHKTYHYGISPDRDGIKEYTRQSSIINGRELSAAELEDAVKATDAVTDAEVWIGTSDYFLYKVKASIDGKQFTEKKANMRMDLVMTGSDYNKSLDLAAPEKSEEFNPIALLMGLSAAQGLGAGGDNGE